MKESKEKLTKTKTVQQKVKTSTKTHSAKKVSTTGDHFCQILLISYINTVLILIQKVWSLGTLGPRMGDSPI